ncbi:MAG: DUF192 domain-containing protein [Richelia sp. SL_2_1]|nr:DUF192 domain-containing protein [Richelia sp. RM1_1_1]NJO29975.1 DUF192 domain-containing protein [Richelia sp. SL_2_1]
MIKNYIKSCQRLLPIVLGFLLVSCFQQTPAKSPDITVSSTPTAVKNLGQELPISAVATTPNGTKIQLEVAQTPQQQAMGLMYRPTLPDNRGMLFDFVSPQPVSFWMKNVPVPLDMVFLRKGVIQYIASSVPPCTQEPCPTYDPKTLIDQVIELRSQRAAELNLKQGDKVIINYMKSK